MKWLTLAVLVASLTACAGMNSTGRTTGSNTSNSNDMTYRGGSL